MAFPELVRMPWKSLRRVLGNTQIIIMTVMDELHHEMHGIEIGSDFYITKPFLPTELLARVNAILRHTTKPAPPISNGHGDPTFWRFVRPAFSKCGWKSSPRAGTCELSAHPEIVGR